MKQLRGLLWICLLLASLFTGCGKQEAVSRTMTETPGSTTTRLPETPEPEQNGDGLFDYEPGTMGSYVMADPDVHGEPRVLEGVTMTLPEYLTRETVSDRQHDLIRDGMQVGGILLVDIPKEMLEEAARTYEGAQALADHLGKQVMPEAYPYTLAFAGGGRSESYNCYIYLIFYNPNILSRAYVHHLFMGESHCYDVWIDGTWNPDTGNMILSTLSSQDIKAEDNSPEYGWKFVEGELIQR